MKNRIASLFLVFALLMSLCTFAVARDNRITVQSSGAERFTDVPTSHWAYDYINKVVGSGLFNGKTSTTFEPSSAMTRSQFVMVMARMEGRSDLEGVVTQTIFPDVTTTRRAAGPIKWATDEGFVNGFGDGTFKPDSPITRGQFAALIHRYIIAKRYVNLHVVDPEPAQFTDAASVSTAFTSDVEYARVHGLLTGYSDGTVRAGNPITRAAIAAILARFLDLVSESGYTPLLDGPVIDGGDSGDSGDSGDTSSSDVPSTYKDIKLTVKNGERGETSFTVTRNGKTVASDDLQPGDRVTISHVPDSGYGVSVRIKDANGKSVTKHTSGNSTWFEAPKDLPVTITVTYSKTSGSGGGGGGSTSGTGTIINPGTGGQVNPTPTKTTYYLLAQAEVISAEHGTVFLTDTQPSATTAAPANLSATRRALLSHEFASNEQHVLTGYALFLPDDGYELDPTTVTVTKPATGADGQPTTQNVTHSDSPTFVRIANDTLRAYWISFTETGNTNSSQDDTRLPDVTIRAGFKAINTDQPVGEVSWTITPNVIGGFVEISQTAFANDKKQITADKLTKTTFTLKKGEGMTVYVAVSPDTANKFVPGDPGLTRKDNGVSMENPTPTARDENKLFLYSITLMTQNTPAQATRVETVLDCGFEADKTVQYGITVTPKYYNNGAIADPPADVNFNVQVDAEEANPNTDVTVSAFATPGYQVREVTVTGKTSGKTSSVTPRTENVDPLEYVFKMPAEDVEVQVVYEDVPDDRLTYNVKVDIQGKGTVSLNIGGEDMTFDTRDLADEEIEDKVKTFTPAPITMLTSEYVAKFGDNATHALPVYLGAAPVPANSYQYDDRNSDWGAFDPESTKEIPDQSLTPGGTLEIKIVFVRERSFGYNLTVIGKGSVEVNFNGNDHSPFSNTTGGVEKTSYSEFVSGTKTVNVSVSAANNGEGYQAFDPENDTVLINDTPYKLTRSYTMGEGMVDIVVAFLKEGVEPTAFTVKINDANNNRVTVRAENGKFVTGNYALPADKDNVVTALKSANAKSSALIDKETTYYAYEDTIITLIPVLADGYKVSKMGVEGDETIADQLDTKGFSYTLKPNASDNVLEVTFAPFQEYRALIQAPFTGSLNGIYDLHSYSVGINGEDTLKKVLYSFNNGRVNAITPASYAWSNNIGNNAGGLYANLNSIIPAYLNANNKKAADDLAKTLTDTVTATLATNLSGMVDAQKNEMVQPSNLRPGQKSDLQQQIDAAISAALAGQSATQTVTLDDDSKATIVKRILDANQDLRNAYDQNVITFDDFVGTADITPLLLTSDENGIAKAKDKSIQSQLQARITEYLLNYLKIDLPKDAQGNVDVETEVHVDASEVRNRGAVITISAEALFDPDRLPSLSDESSFEDYMYPAGGTSKLSTWCKTVATVTLKQKTSESAEYTNLRTTFNANSLPQTDVFSLAKLGADNPGESAITGALQKVDEAIKNTWDAKWTDGGGLITSNDDGKYVLTVNMGQVLTKEMLDVVVEGDGTRNNEGVLGDLLTTLTDKVSALGGKANATATKAAVLNIYRDFVVFNPGQNTKLIELKTKGSDNNTIGIVNNNGELELELNFLNLIRDAATPTDLTSFEKLLDLATALRDGLATDIRNNPDTDGTAQAVLAGLIRGQISNKGELVATKWGATISSNGRVGRAMTALEKEELANLTAELLMRSLDTPMDATTTDDGQTVEGAWTRFEEKGYRSVSMSFNVDEGRFPELVEALKTFNAQSAFGDKIRAGFKIQQALEGDN